MTHKLILILGGARSGKSRYAMEMAARLGRRIVHLATATAGDEEMRQRIEEHRRERPADWQTIEATENVGQVLAQIADPANSSGARADVVILDCLTLLVSNLMAAAGDAASRDALDARVQAEVDGILHAFHTGHFTLIIVSNEVGMGIVPAYPLGRSYRDLLGGVNQRVAREADQVFLMVAGLPVEIKTLA
ncbi:MAG: bifunctional adenosylcobinamide kinase/adenosylcobinamide-phosphate guanylyltransferase, partial [Chloroflexi bacterium]|nr:bifunctional adenosylcobinamide kinase/adenosylcobinamide-phosphate guanylyltransferase [Chloroflexota bacterium]